MAESDKSENQVYGIILFMSGRPRKNMTEAKRHDFKLESSKMSHAKARRIAWGERHKSPSRTSAMPPPSLDVLRDAYQRRNESCESMIRLGSMLEDIEAAHGVRRTALVTSSRSLMTAARRTVSSSITIRRGRRAFAASSRMRPICSPRTRRSCATRNCQQTSAMQLNSTTPIQLPSCSMARMSRGSSPSANVRASCWMAAGGRFASWRRELRISDNNRGSAPNPDLSTR